MKRLREDKTQQYAQDLRLNGTSTLENRAGMQIESTTSSMECLVLAWSVLARIKHSSTHKTFT
jgi:hypothetical protein